MGAFVNPNARVTVSDESGNNVVIRAKMSIGVNANTVADTARYGSTVTGQRLALLANNIVDWDGPMFQDEAGQPIKCNRAKIFSLDPTYEPWAKLQALVLAKIDEINTKPTIEVDDPN